MTKQLPQSSQSPDRQQLVDSESTLFTCHGCHRWITVQSDKHAIGASYAYECRDCQKVRRKGQFEKVCPPFYQATERNRLPQDQFQQVISWEYGPAGLILLGDTGKCKTRCAWELLRRVMVEDKKELKVVHFDCISFGHEIMRHYRDEDVDQWLTLISTCPIVFMDDLGKLKMTERAEVELFGMVERRIANQLPLIVTTNDTGDSLAARMTDNRGPALIRRLREFCKPIQF